jgi:ribosomal protein S27AE
MQAYRYALDLTPAQQRLVAAHAGVVKGGVAPWWAQCSKEAFNTGAGVVAEVRRQPAYKRIWNGGRLIVADRWYPSSKTCSACGAAKTKLALSEREYSCGVCGLVLDRDHNAALNLAALAAEFDTAGRCSSISSLSDRDRRTAR